MAAGLLSTMESIHFGKPFIGVPVFFDQHFNMRVAESKGQFKLIFLSCGYSFEPIQCSSNQTIIIITNLSTGYGISVPVEIITEHKLRSAIRNILSNRTYLNQVNIASDRFRNRIATPLETVVYWVEHIAKNNGAPYLKSVAVDLPFYIYYNLDVWTFGFVMLMMICFILKMIMVKAMSVITSKIKMKTS